MHLNKDQFFKFSIIVPCYNEEYTIEQIILDIKKLIKSKNLNAEIIVINDGSTDNSHKIILKHDVQLINNPRNLGLGASLKKGVLNSKGDIVVFMDSDGQHDVSDLENIILQTDENNIVISERPPNSDFSKFRMIGKYLIRFFLNYLTNQKINDFNSGLRAIKKHKILKIINLLPEKFSFVTTSLLLFSHFNEEIKFVKINTRIRSAGKSYVNIMSFISTLIYLVNLSILFKPLKILLPFSFVTMSFGFLSFIYYYFNDGVIGIKSIMIIIFAFILFFVGYILNMLVDIKIKQYKDN